jgi:hypothetical protein
MRIAHQSMGAALPPDAAAPPATAPGPGGAPGEPGRRSSDAPPLRGAFVRDGSDAVAWRDALGGCDVTSGGTAEGTACAGVGALSGAAHKVATPGARCESAIDGPRANAEAGMLACRGAKVGLGVPSGPRSKGKATGGGGAVRTCAMAAGSVGAAGRTEVAACVVTGAVGCVAPVVGSVAVESGVAVFAPEESPAWLPDAPVWLPDAPVWLPDTPVWLPDVLSSVLLSEPVLVAESFVLDCLLVSLESLAVESLDVVPLASLAVESLESLDVASLGVESSAVCPAAAAVVDPAGCAGGASVVAGGGEVVVAVAVAVEVAASAAPAAAVLAVDVAASAVVVAASAVVVAAVVVVVTAVVAVVVADVAAPVTVVVAASSVGVVSAAAAFATEMLSAPSKTSVPASTRREDLA